MTMCTAEPGTSLIIVRRLSPDDDIGALTALLHRAYTPQVAMGLRPLAGRQDAAMTRARTSKGECFVALRDNAIIGTILLNEYEHVDFPPKFCEPGVAHFSLFAVDPDLQGGGVGRLLLDAIEARALELGDNQLAMSVAEPDADLVRYYERRGFETVSHWRWPYTNYRSVVMCKRIGTRD